MKAFFPYEERTGDIVVRVAVSYLAAQSSPGQSRWFWSYHVRVENMRQDGVQLLSRHWEITDGLGECQVVDGEGVVGETPLILPGRSFDYVSGCPLHTPTGRMRGWYTMRDESGAFFDVMIPTLDLRASVEAA
jgi:ApaG protein